MPDITIDEQELANLRSRAEAADSAAASAEAAQTTAAQLQEQLNAGAGRYAAAVRAANPDIPADVISGDSFDAIDAAAQTARKVADAVKPATPTEPTPAAPVVPPGAAPTRNAGDETSGTTAQRVSAELARRAGASGPIPGK